VPSATVAIDIHQAFDVVAHLATERAFNFEIVLDNASDADRFVFGQILDAAARVESDLITDPASRSRSDSENVRQTDYNPFLVRYVDTGYTCHVKDPFRALTLALFVTLVLADHPNDAFAPDDLAVCTYSLY